MAENMEIDGAGASIPNVPATLHINEADMTAISAGLDAIEPLPPADDASGYQRQIGHYLQEQAATLHGGRALTVQGVAALQHQAAAAAAGEAQGRVAPNLWPEEQQYQLYPQFQFQPQLQAQQQAQPHLQPEPPPVREQQQQHRAARRRREPHATVAPDAPRSFCARFRAASVGVNRRLPETREFRVRERGKPKSAYKVWMLATNAPPADQLVADDVHGFNFMGTFVSEEGHVDEIDPGLWTRLQEYIQAECEEGALVCEIQPQGGKRHFHVVGKRKVKTSDEWMVYHMATRVMIDNVKVYCLVEVAHGGSLYKSSGIRGLYAYLVKGMVALIVIFD